MARKPRNTTAVSGAIPAKVVISTGVADVEDGKASLIDSALNFGSTCCSEVGALSDVNAYGAASTPRDAVALGCLLAVRQ
jgi:hypothetical protein